MRPAGTFDVSYAQDMAIVRTRLQWVLVVLFLIALFVFPAFSGIYWLHIFTLTGIVLIAVFGLHITTGLCGLINLGQSAFMGVGAYTSAILTNHGVPFPIALPLAGIMAGTVGLVFGAPSLKIKEFYLAMATLAAQFIIIYIIVHMPALTKGAMGMNVPPAEIAGFKFDSDFKMYYLVIAVTVLMGLFARNITRTRVGRAFVAIRDNDLAAEVMGVNLFSYKLLAFFIGCFFAGIAGSLWAHYYSFIGFENFTLKDSVWFLGMLIIGGIGSTLGAVLGTLFIRLLTVLTDYIAPILSAVFPFLGTNVVFAVGTVVFAIVIVVFLVFEPRGLAHRWGIFKASYRLWPYAY